METQTWLSRHNEFISAENITILTVSSDDFLYAFLEVAEQQNLLNTNIYTFSFYMDKYISIRIEVYGSPYYI